MRFLTIVTILSFLATAAASAAPESAEKMTDGEITKMLLTINQGEIAAGKLAGKMAKNKETKEFAAMMVKEHEQNVRATASLAKTMNIEPVGNEATEALRTEAKNDLDALKKEKNDFDGAYLSQQIAMHEKALGTLDNELIPNAQRENLRKHLEKTRTAVQAHLTHVQALKKE